MGLRTVEAVVIAVVGIAVAIISAFLTLGLRSMVAVDVIALNMAAGIIDLLSVKRYRNAWLIVAIVVGLLVSLVCVCYLVMHNSSESAAIFRAAQAAMKLLRDSYVVIMPAMGLAAILLLVSTGSRSSEAIIAIVIGTSMAIIYMLFVIGNETPGVVPGILIGMAGVTVCLLFAVGIKSIEAIIAIVMGAVITTICIFPAMGFGYILTNTQWSLGIFMRTVSGSAISIVYDIFMTPALWTMWLVMGIAMSMLYGSLASDVAAEYGYPSRRWFACGFILGALGMIAAAVFLRPRRRETTKKCPECAEPMGMNLRKCANCGHEFGDEELISHLGEIIQKRFANWSKAVEVLTEVKTPAAVPYLQQALSSDYMLKSRIRDKVMQALIEIGAVPGLITVLKEGTRNLKEKAAKMLKENADASAVPELLNLLESPDYIVSTDTRLAAISILAEVRDETAIPSLISALADSSTRDRARATLMEIGDQALPYLEEKRRQLRRSREHADRVVANIAEGMIAEIKYVR